MIFIKALILGLSLTTLSDVQDIQRIFLHSKEVETSDGDCVQLPMFDYDSDRPLQWAKNYIRIPIKNNQGSIILQFKGQNIVSLLLPIEDSKWMRFKMNLESEVLQADRILLEREFGAVEESLWPDSAIPRLTMVFGNGNPEVQNLNELTLEILFADILSQRAIQGDILAQEKAFYEVQQALNDKFNLERIRE